MRRREENLIEIKNSPFIEESLKVIDGVNQHVGITQ